MRRITSDEIIQMRRSGFERLTIIEAEEWLSACDRADQVIVLIRDAFSGVTLGEGMGLREAASNGKLLKAHRNYEHDRDENRFGNSELNAVA